MRLAQFDEPPRIADRGIDLQAIADDPAIAQQAGDVFGTEAGDAIDVPSGERRAEGGTLLQDGQPGQPGLVDLEHEALEQYAVLPRGEAVFGFVIGAMLRMPGGRRAIAVAHPRAREK